jgi:hypothetical protein
MVKNRDYLETIAANFGKDQVIRAPDVPPLFTSYTEVEVVVPHNV